MLKRSLLLAAFAAVVLASPVFADGPVCADCHDEVAAGMTNQIHMRIQPFEVSGRQVGCEGCHGDGAAHMEEGDTTPIRTFADWTLEDVAACVDCHVTEAAAGAICRTRCSKSAARANGSEKIVR